MDRDTSWIYSNQWYISHNGKKIPWAVKMPFNFHHRMTAIMHTLTKESISIPRWTIQKVKKKQVYSISNPFCLLYCVSILTLIFLFHVGCISDGRLTGLSNACLFLIYCSIYSTYCASLWTKVSTTHVGLDSMEPKNYNFQSFRVQNALLWV